MKWEYSGDYLKQFPANYTGAIGNMFCQAVRQGAEEVSAVFASVRRQCTHRLGTDWINREQRDVYMQVSQSIGSYDSEDFAKHILWRESLPDELKFKLKNEAKSAGLKNKMSAEPASEKQLAYLKSLGCQVVPKSKLEASELISQFLKQAA